MIVTPSGNKKLPRAIAHDSKKLPAYGPDAVREI